MLKKLPLILLVSVFVTLLNASEKYAIIYSPVKENISIVKSLNNLDSKDMEKVWKVTFLNWKYINEKFIESD